MDPGGQEIENVGGHHITTREARKSPYTVELAVFIDDSLVSYVKKRYPSANAKKKTKEIVVTLLTVVNQLFSDASLEDAALSLRVLRLKFMGRSAVDAADGEGGVYLNNFCRWQTSKITKKGASRWDHSLLLTGLDLYSDTPTSKKTMGMSFVGGMCTPGHSCSVVEATKFTSAYIIAHELGHSLSLVHDGDSPASSCSSTGYIMSVSLNDGGHTWSSCSRNQLRTFLDMRGTCLTEASGGDGNKGFLDDDLPGSTIDADQQCHYMYGEGWTHAAEQYPDVCAEIWCLKGLRLRSPLVSALDGTSCGSDKVCLKGVCKPLEAPARVGARYFDYDRQQQPKWRKKKRVKQMKKIAKKVMKNQSRKENEKKKGLKVKVAKQIPDESLEVYRTARKKWEEEDKEAKKAEKKIATKEYIEMLTELFEEMKESLKGSEGETDWVKGSNRENRVDPFWWMEGEAKENRKKVKTQNKPGRRDGDRRGKDNVKGKRKRRKRIKGRKRQNKRLDDGARNRKPLPRIRKIESPTHIIIKERKKYVEGKGWKVHILKIKKSNKLSRKRVNVKKYTIICDKSQSQCRITKRQSRNKVRMLKRKGKSRKDH